MQKLLMAVLLSCGAFLLNACEKEGIPNRMDNACLGYGTINPATEATESTTSDVEVLYWENVLIVRSPYPITNVALRYSACQNMQAIYAQHERHDYFGFTHQIELTYEFTECLIANGADFHVGFSYECEVGE